MKTTINVSIDVEMREKIKQTQLNVSTFLNERLKTHFQAEEVVSERKEDLEAISKAEMQKEAELKALAEQKKIMAQKIETEKQEKAKRLEEEARKQRSCALCGEELNPESPATKKFTQTSYIHKSCYMSRDQEQINKVRKDLEAQEAKL